MTISLDIPQYLINVSLSSLGLSAKNQLHQNQRGLQLAIFITLIWIKAAQLKYQVTVIASYLYCVCNVYGSWSQQLNLALVVTEPQGNSLASRLSPSFLHESGLRKHYASETRRLWQATEGADRQRCEVMITRSCSLMSHAHSSTAA